MSQHLRALLLLCSGFFCSQAFATTYVPIQVGDITVIIPINDPPVAQADSVSVNEDTPAVIDVLANDSDENLASVTINLTQGSNQGLLTLAPDGRSFNYSPNANYHGVDSFSYSITDENGNTSESVTVAITVRPQNDAPMALDVTATVNEDNSISINPNASDIDGDALTPAIARNPVYGTSTLVNGKFHYQPNSNFTGTDTFTYTVSDNDAMSLPATVTITVNPVNDPPVWDVNSPVFAQLDAKEDDTFNEWTFAELNQAINDPDGDTITFTGGTALNGVISQFDNSTLRYQTNLNFNGVDTVTLYATDGISPQPASVTFDLNVRPTFDVPQVSLEVLEFTADNKATLYIHVIDPDGVPKKVGMIVNKPDGSHFHTDSDITDTLVSFPSENRYRYEEKTRVMTDSGTYSVDVNITDFGTFIFHDLPLLEYNYDVPNTKPIASNDAVETNEDTLVSHDVISNDSDEQTTNNGQLAIKPGSVRFNAGSSGTLSNTVREITFTPDADFHGPVEILYAVQDPEGLTDEATLFVTVTPVNDAPDFGGNLPTDVSVSSGSLYSYQPSVTDVEQQSFTFSINVTLPGWLSFNTETGVLTGSPSHSDSGVSGVIITATDSLGASSSTPAFNIAVTSNNTPPVFNNTNPSQTASVGIQYQFDASATDAEGDTLAYSLTGAGSWLQINSSTGLLSGTPQVSDLGVDSGIEIRVTDNNFAPVVLGPFSIEVNANSITATITAPTNSSMYYGPIVVSASSSDDSQTQNVQFRLNGGAWQVDNNAPWSATFNMPQAGDNLIEVKAVNSSNEESSVVSRNIKLTLLPTEVTIVKPSQLNGEFEVTWTGVAGASSYELQEQINDAGWNSLGTVSDISFAFTGKLPAKYDYRVKAISSSGEESGWSSAKYIVVEVDLEQCRVE